MQALADQQLLHRMICYSWYILAITIACTSAALVLKVPTLVDSKFIRTLISYVWCTVAFILICTGVADLLLATRFFHMIIVAVMGWLLVRQGGLGIKSLIEKHLSY